MSADAETAVPATALARPYLRPAHFDDYEEVMRLEATLSWDPPSAEHWTALWRESPLWSRLAQTWTIGWVLETVDGEVVGSIGNIPLQYHFNGQEFVAASGRGWVVAPKYRGFALWLLEERFNQPSVDVFVDTTISPLALEAFDEFADRVPIGDWETVPYFVTRHRDFAENALRKLNVPLPRVLASPAGAALHLKGMISGKSFPKAYSSCVIETPDRFDSRFDAFWAELLRQNPDTLLATRDSATLSWHFSASMRRNRIWIYTASRNGLMRAYAIFMRRDRPQELRRMRLVDYQSIDRDVDLLPPLVETALRQCAADDISVLDKPGVGLRKMQGFDQFAPYRGKQTWPLFYRAVDPGLAVALREPKVWDPSEYDGDGSI